MVVVVASEKAMATHSSVLAWRIPGTGEARGLLSVGSHRVGHDWSDLAAAAAAVVAWRIPWRRKRQSTLIFLPGKSHGQRGLVGYSPWECRESDTTERLHFHFSLSLFTFMHWRRKWHPTPVFLPGGSQGPGSLVGCRLWGHTESDTTKST